jgi:hypothetical protein
VLLPSAGPPALLVEAELEATTQHTPARRKKKALVRKVVSITITGY